MRLDLSVPKTNPVSCGEDGEDGLLLSTLREGMERALADMRRICQDFKLLGCY